MHQFTYGEQKSLIGFIDEISSLDINTANFPTFPTFFYATYIGIFKSMNADQLSNT